MLQWGVIMDVWDFNCIVSHVGSVGDVILCESFTFDGQLLEIELQQIVMY